LRGGGKGAPTAAAFRAFAWTARSRQKGRGEKNREGTIKSGRQAKGMGVEQSHQKKRGETLTSIASGGHQHRGKGAKKKKKIGFQDWLPIAGSKKIQKGGRGGGEKTILDRPRLDRESNKRKYKKHKGPPGPQHAGTPQVGHGKEMGKYRQDHPPKELRKKT